MKTKSKRPAINQVGFNLFDGFAHGSDAEHVLDEGHFDEDNGIIAGATSFSRISILDE